MKRKKMHALTTTKKMIRFHGKYITYFQAFQQIATKLLRKSLDWCITFTTHNSLYLFDFPFFHVVLLFFLLTSFSQPLDFTDEQILRLIGATGDQQIISREYINGEHHILTRNENGEHIITRIVTVCSLNLS